MRSIKKYIPFAKAGFMEFITYKFQIIGWLIANIITFALIFFLWKAVYEDNPDHIINGFNFIDMVHYMIMAQVTAMIIGSSSSFWIVIDDIKTGNIAMTLIKPINYRLKSVFYSFGNLLAFFIVILIPVLAFTYTWLYFLVGVQIPGVLNILLYIISCILAFMVFDCFNYLVGLLAFYTQAGFGLMQIKEVIVSFLSGALIPLAFFPSWTNNIMRFLPFASMNETPNMILLGKYADFQIITTMAIQVLWIIILGVVGRLFYLRAIKKIVIQGG